jgi:hypothetical protein
MKIKQIFSVAGLCFVLFICVHCWAKIRRTEDWLQTDYLADKEEIQNLMRQALKWGWDEAKDVINLLPVLVEDSIYIGFDLYKLETNLSKLRVTD